ncbi:unnamed protein product [Bursaphelenchus okinawaensis]|uniref:Uncharacterized protein n=1 Tax=Bursaphelenchus okinawaensis TaxID=465554 RepID=A0A811KV31_9BILA|nr:unnamed protein product [Bursaphelenchus okinawaensis]CAG9112750.1 unnamed protein product [Bursaphelenchus okinawaensis]
MGGSNPLPKLSLPLALKKLPSTALVSPERAPVSKEKNLDSEDFQQSLGVTFDYESYFKKKRDKCCAKRYDAALTFTTGLESFVMQMVKDSKKINRLLRPKQPPIAPKCSVCDLFTLEERTTVYFYLWSDKKGDGMSISWNEVSRNPVRDMGNGQYSSGPVKLCNECVKTMRWSQQRVEWHHVRGSLKHQKFQELPTICGLYNQLQTAMRLVHFCTIEYNLNVLRLTSSQLLQLEANLQVHRDSVERAGKEIMEQRSLPSLTGNGHELLLYSNIRMYSAYFLQETRRDLSEASQKAEKPEPTASWIRRHLLCA